MLLYRRSLPDRTTGWIDLAVMLGALVFMQLAITLFAGHDCLFAQMLTATENSQATRDPLPATSCEPVLAIQRAAGGWQRVAGSA